mgnify:FL=1
MSCGGGMEGDFEKGELNKILKINRGNKEENEMVGIKEEAIKIIKEMPENVDFEDIMAELYFREKVKKGLKELDEGKSISNLQLTKKIKRWLK